MYYASRTVYAVETPPVFSDMHKKGPCNLATYTAERFLWEYPLRREFTSGGGYDLFLVLRGAAVFRCGGALLPIDPDTMVIFKPGEAGTLDYAGGRGALELIRVELPSAALHALADETTDPLKAFNTVPFRQIAVRGDNEVYMLQKNLARKLCELPNEKDLFGASLYEEGILKLFVVLALRVCILAERHNARASRRHLMLDEVFLYIQAHLDEEITLKQLEEHFYVSHEHISREFKRQTGQTVHAYIIKAKLDRCCRLIEQGYPITEVYRKVGFGGYNNFFRAFKKEYGMTPKEYFRTTRAGARG